MSYLNTRQDFHGNGQFGYTCRRITRGKSAGKFIVEYGLAERDGPACRARIIRGTVEEDEAREFCKECLIAFPEPAAPKPLALSHTSTLLLSKVVVGEWFLPYAILIRRPTFVCQHLHKLGILEQRWRGGIRPTSEQILDRSWDVRDFHEYRLTVAAVLALGSVEVSIGTRTTWATRWGQAAHEAQHFYLNGTRLCGDEPLHLGALYQATPTAQACARCCDLLASAGA